MSYFTAITQSATVSEGNSSVVNVGAGDTFTGTSASTLGANAIQVSLKTDQNCTVYVEQSPEGTNWDLIDTYNFHYSIGNFGITVQAISSYFRVRVKNISASITTYFRLQSVLCPIVEAVPRSLDDNGNLKVSINEIEDHYGFESENTPMGEQRSIEPVRLVGAQFSGSALDYSFWTPVVGSGATIIADGAQIRMFTGATANATSSLTSSRRGRYLGGAAHRYRSVVRLPDTGITSNVRKWGAFDGTDGAYFTLDGTTFGVVTIKSGTATTVNSGSFNGTEGAVYSLGTSAATYEIYWTNSRVWFAVGEDLIHTVGAATTTWCNTIHLPCRLENNNYNGGNTNIALDCRTSTIYRLGKAETRPIYRNINALGTYNLKSGPGTLQRIVLFSAGAASNTVTIYDSLTGAGTQIGAFPTTGTTLAVPTTVETGVDFYTGLTVVVATGTAANMTFVYE